MTTQVPEVLHFASRRTYFHENVLGDALPKSDFVTVDYSKLPNNTALMRGYVGHWRIREGQLYLIYLAGSDTLTMASLFPGREGEIPADWFTGTISLPYGGRLVDIYSMGRGFSYASYLMLVFAEGKFVRTFIDNGEPKCPFEELPAWMQKAVERRRLAQVAPPPPPSSEGDHMPAKVIELVLNGVPPVRAWRCYLGVSETELAGRAGMSLAALAQHEQREPEADTRSLPALARALGVTADDLAYV